jgi:hypothetical protein
MSSFREGYESPQAKILGNIFTLAFRIAWFFFRIAWWLSIFLVCSMIAGIAALVRHGRPDPDEPEGFGSYSEDRSQWQDHRSGQRYPVRQQDHETCEVQAAMGGLAWRRNALSRLVKRGAIFNYTFSAISNGSPDASPETVASARFLNEARHNITLDHLDPAEAQSDPYNLGDNRAEAEHALEHLDWLLANRGWSWNHELNDHWYGRIYERPIILWDQPIATDSLPAAEG